MTIDTCFDEFRKELEEHGRWASERPIRIVRKARGLTHEDFSDISSCTYLSSLERNLKSPTLDKLAQLAAVLQVHPVTLVALSTLAAPEMGRVRELLALLDRELGGLTDIGPGAG